MLKNKKLNREMKNWNKKTINKKECNNFSKKLRKMTNIASEAKNKAMLYDIIDNMNSFVFKNN